MHHQKVWGMLHTIDHKRKEYMNREIDDIYIDMIYHHHHLYPDLAHTT